MRTLTQPHSVGRYFPFFGRTTCPVAGPIVMQEKAPLRKVDITTPVMYRNVNLNSSKKSGRSTEVHKESLPPLNDRTQQKVSSVDGLRNNFAARCLPEGFGRLCSKRFLTSEKTASDTTPIISQSTLTDVRNRDCAAKNSTASFSVNPACAEQKSVAGFVNGEYGSTKALVGHLNQTNDFDHGQSMAAVSRKISNEHVESRHRNSQQSLVSVQEYMKRLRQAHQIVDELLESRGLKVDDGIHHLRKWHQQLDGEQNADVSYLETSEKTARFKISHAPQQHHTSNASDSGFSMDTDSENDILLKLLGANSQSFTTPDLTQPKKQAKSSLKSIEANITKVKNQKNVDLKMIIRKAQYYCTYLNVKIKLGKVEICEKTADSSLRRNSKKIFKDKQQMVADETEEFKGKNQTQTCARSSEENCETVYVCYRFVNEFFCFYEATFSLSTASCATAKRRTIVVSGKKFSDRIEMKRKLKSHKNDLSHAILLVKTGKLPIDLKMLSEEENTEKKIKIIVKQKGNDVVDRGVEITKTKKVINSNKTKKLLKVSTPRKVSAKKFKAPEESTSLFSASHVEKIMPSQTRRPSISSEQATVFKNFSSQSLQLETAMTVTMRSNKIKITKLLVVEQTNSKRRQYKRLLKPKNTSVSRRKDCFELEKVQKPPQSLTVATPKYCQKKNSSVVVLDHSADSEISRSRNNTRSINFKSFDFEMESRTSFVHRINEGQAKSAHKTITSLDTSSENNDKKDQLAETSTKYPKEEICHSYGTTAKKNTEHLDGEVVHAKGCNRHMFKPQVKIPAGSVYDERKQATVVMRYSSKLHQETLSTASPTSRFIPPRTSPSADVTVTQCTATPASVIQRHVPENHFHAATAPLKSIMSSGSGGKTTAVTLQQHSPGNPFDATLGCVDRAATHKSEPRGAIAQSASNKPWVPKWRRIQWYTLNRLTYLSCQFIEFKNSTL